MRPADTRNRFAVRSSFHFLWLSWKGVWGKPFFGLQRMVSPRKLRTYSAISITVWMMYSVVVVWLLLPPKGFWKPPEEVT